MSVMLYKTPGLHKYDLGMFDQMVVPDEEVEKFLKVGWFKTQQEAVDVKTLKKVEPPSIETEVVEPPVPEPPKSKAKEAIEASRSRRK